MFSDFRLISPSDIAYLREIFSSAQKEAWCYFPPFLTLYNLLPSRPVYLYRHRLFAVIAQKVTSRGRDRIDLLVPPVALDDNGVDWLNELIHFLDNNNDQADLRILWLDNTDLEFLLERFGESLQYQLKDRDYFYDPKKIFDMKGKEFRDFRKKIHRIDRLYPSFREFQFQDIELAETLLKAWRRGQGRKRDFLLDWGYTLAALKRFYEFSRSDLYGWQVSLSGCLKAFALTGPISDKLGCFFVAKTDTQIDGLSEYLRWRVSGQLTNFELVNDAGDLGIPGLRQHKMKLRPSKFNDVYSAVLSHRRGSPTE